MKVLIISQYFLPDITAAANRVGDIASILGERGHEVEIVTSTPHKSDTSDSSEANLKNINITRVSVNKLKSSSLTAYLSQYLGFSLGAFTTSKLVLKRFDCDVIWVTSPPLPIVISTLLLKFLYRPKVVLDVRDIWPESAVSVGKIKRGGIGDRLGRLLERAAYYHASAITCVSKNMKSYIEGKTNTPITVIYNSVRKNEMEHTSGKNIKPNPDVFCYSGNLGLAQDLETLLEAFAAALKNEVMRNAQLIIVGDGAVRQKLERLVDDLNISQSVIFTGALSKSHAITHMLEAGTLLIPLMESDAFKLTVPSKVFDCLSLQRPIISSVQGEAMEILSSTGANTIVTSGNVESLANAFTSTRNDWDDLYMLAKQNRTVVEESFTREQSVDELEKIFSSVVKNTKVVI